jgi:hypothetical protein
MARKNEGGKPSPKRRPRAAPAAPPEFDGLTYRQRLFVFHFLGSANGNATEAARLAGYSSPKQQGTENLAKPSIRAALDANLAGPALAAEETLARLADIATVDMGDFARFYVARHRKGGTWLEFDLKAAKAAGISHLIKSIKPTRNGMAIELHDSLAALDKLSRVHGLYRADTRDADPDRADTLAGKLAELAASLRARGVPGEPDGG